MRPPIAPRLEISAAPELWWLQYGALRDRAGACVTNERFPVTNDMKMHSAHDSIARSLRVPALRWLLGSAALIAGLIAYCELCSLIYGEPAVGLRTSWVWALEASAGWIIVGAALGAFGDRLAAYASAHGRARLVAGVCILCGAAFCVGCEAVLAWLIDGAPLGGARDSVAALIYARAPVSVLASTVLAVAWIAQRKRMGANAATQPTPEAPERSVHGDEECPRLASFGAADVIDVMTGTGRATIRVAEVESFRADRNYITVAHISGRRYLLRQTMSSLEQSLDATLFQRIHRSTIVNRAMIVERRRNGVLVLKSGEHVQVSRAARRRTQ
jgi:DNA-binding LytR/AlgR family response regulator